MSSTFTSRDVRHPPDGADDIEEDPGYERADVVIGGPSRCAVQLFPGRDRVGGCGDALGANGT